MQRQPGVYRVIRSTFNLSQRPQLSRCTRRDPFLPQIRPIEDPALALRRLDIGEHRDENAGQWESSRLIALGLLLLQPDRPVSEIDLRPFNL